MKVSAVGILVFSGIESSEAAETYTNCWDKNPLLVILASLIVLGLISSSFYGILKVSEHLFNIYVISFLHVLNLKEMLNFFQRVKSFLIPWIIGNAIIIISALITAIYLAANGEIKAVIIFFVAGKCVFDNIAIAIPYRLIFRSIPLLLVLHAQPLQGNGNEQRERQDNTNNSGTTKIAFQIYYVTLYCTNFYLSKHLLLF